MAKFQVQGKKIEEPKIKLVPLRNDRPLEEFEIVAEQNAIELSIKGYKRIVPVPGTLGYLFRDLTGGNKSVYEFVLNVLPQTNGRGKGSSNNEKLAKQVILLWNALDEFSQNRVDVFDHLCDRVGLIRREFYSFAAKGMYDHFDAISQRILMESKPELVNNVRQFAQQKEHYKDRELLAKATGVTKDTPLIGSIDASTKVQNNLVLDSNFNSSMRETEKAIREAEGEIFVEAEIVSIEPTQLSEVSTEFLNNELMENEKEDLLAVLRK